MQSTRTLRLLLLILCLVKCAAATAAENLYQIRDSHLVINTPERTSPTVLLNVSPALFTEPKTIRMERLVVTSGTVQTSAFRIPAAAREVTFTARAFATHDIWPRVRVRLNLVETPFTGLIMYDHFWVSRSMKSLVVKLPEQFRGKQCECVVELLNPDLLSERERRQLAVADLQFF